MLAVVEVDPRRLQPFSAFDAFARADVRDHPLGFEHRVFDSLIG